MPKWIVEMDDEQAKKLAQHLNRSVVLERAEAALNAVLSAPVNAGAEALQMLGWIKKVEEPNPSKEAPEPNPSNEAPEPN